MRSTEVGDLTGGKEEQNRDREREGTSRFTEPTLLNARW